jgi:ATP-dependent DNA ligase
VALPLDPPIPPQLARSAATLPDGDTWAYEPKYDGFRAIAFVDGERVYLQSRGSKPLGRYFPEVAFPPGRYILDGELVVFDADGGHDFEALQQRIHPARSRIERLARELPARYMAFDLIARDDETLLELPFAERRELLAELVADPVELTPQTRDRAAAEPWLHGAEGVLAKDVRAPYRPGERVGMVKVKRVRTIDCVVVGWRPGKAEGTVGSLILGLYDDGGELRVVGHTSGFSAAEKRALPARLGIRHGAKVVRWRDDKPPAECRIEQLAA